MKPPSTYASFAALCSPARDAARGGVDVRPVRVGVRAGLVVRLDEALGRVEDRADAVVAELGEPVVARASSRRQRRGARSRACAGRCRGEVGRGGKGARGARHLGRAHEPRVCRITARRILSACSVKQAKLGNSRPWSSSFRSLKQLCGAEPEAAVAANDQDRQDQAWRRARTACTCSPRCGAVAVAALVARLARPRRRGRDRGRAARRDARGRGRAGPTTSSRSGARRRRLLGRRAGEGAGDCARAFGRCASARGGRRRRRRRARPRAPCCLTTTSTAARRARARWSSASAGARVARMDAARKEAEAGGAAVGAACRRSSGSA